MKKVNKLHIFIIILGSIFILINAFHSNLWIDETFSIELSKKSFIDIWNSGMIDVHPVLYYWLLHIINFFSKLFNNPQITIVMARIFSSLATIILGVVGYTHVKKDFGDKAGIIFSFLVFFMPVQIIYSQEIRMYTWLLLFVTMSSIYAQRLIKNSNSNKNIILFTLFNVAASYTHYYGLMTNILINLVIILWLIKTNRKMIKKIIVSILCQIVIYIPWIPNFINQTKMVSDDFWVKFIFSKTILETFEFQFTGNNIGDWNYITPMVGIVFGIIIVTYSIFKNLKKKDNTLLNLFTIVIYISVFLIAIIISFRAPILYPRYILSITGLLYLYLANALADSNKKFIILICVLIMIFGIKTNIKVFHDNYHPSNMQQIEYVKKDIKEDDIIIYKLIDMGAVYAVNFPNTKQFLYDKEDWAIESYKIYMPTLKKINSLYELKDYTGTIWIINNGYDNENSLYKEVSQHLKTTDIETKTFKTVYQRYRYTVTKVIKRTPV